jgi:hypothetical protein
MDKSALIASGDERREECRHEATTQRECSCGATQKRAQSHAATSRFSIAESPNRIPSLMPTPPLPSRFTASTYRMHRVNQALAQNLRPPQ